MQRQTETLLAAAIVVGAFAAGTAAVVAIGSDAPVTSDEPTAPALETFADEREFREYVRAGATGTGVRAAAAGGGDGASRTARTTDDAASAAGDGGSRESMGTGTAPERVGTTNVQVRGVDEPDLVKTDGTHVFYAPAGRGSPFHGEPRPTTVDGARPVVERPPEQRRHGISVVDIREPADPELAGRINESGTLLRSGDTLVVLARDEVAGYDVSAPGSPKREWSRPLNGSLTSARLVDGRLVLVTASPVGAADPCPVEPLGGAAGVACSDVHRPPTQVPVEAVYTVATVDPATGAVGDTESVVGTRQTVVYASGEDLYLTYTERTGRLEILLGYLGNHSEVAPPDVRQRAREIRASNRTTREKWQETRDLLRGWLHEGHTVKERERLQRQARTELRAYVAENGRKFTRTGVVRVALGSDLRVAAHGTVPGEPLNQFSLDARDGTLRIATTVPAPGTGESANDLYTLGTEALERQGAVTGMGTGQRVYAVRYVEDTAYVVTFRQVDPLHVVDLSDPADPVERGSLELPGFSTYLHPIDDDHVLGIGEEDGRVKAVLFDVSEPTAPTVDDSLRLSSGWSAVAGSHHAFTIDRKHGVFVLPAGRSSLVVDYTDSRLSVRKRVGTDDPATRARYVGDYLYVFAGDTITVLDETTWETVGELALASDE